MKDNNGVLENFSVVVQGKIFGQPKDKYADQLTLQCIESVRKVLPGAEIIISTWKGSHVSHLPYDKVIFNEDPGAVLFNEDIPNFYNNNNRQIVSTYNGLKAATKKYAIKIRGDCQLVDTSFLNYFKDYARAPEYKFLKQRVIIPTKYSRNPRRIALLFHPSDIFQIGLTEDLLDLWNIPLQPEPETTRGVPKHKRVINDALPGPGFRMKHCSEQYLWYAFAKQKGLDLELKNFSHLPANKIFSSEKSIINNFIIADAEQIGLLLPKKFRDHKFKDLYTSQEWEELYERYSIKGTGILYEPWLITQVYASNIKHVLKRAFKKVIRDGKKILGIKIDGAQRI